MHHVLKTKQLKLNQLKKFTHYKRKKTIITLHGYKVVECCIPFNYFFLCLLIVSSSILTLNIARALAKQDVFNEWFTN